MPPETALSTASRRTRSVGIIALPLALALLAGMLPGALLAADPSSGGPTLGEPTVHYEEALAHADDEIAFTPGARVLTGFTPKTRTASRVGRGSSLALPAGLLSGRDMAAGKVAAGTSAAGDALPKLLAEEVLAASAAPVATSDPGASADPNATPSPDPNATPTPAPTSAAAPPVTGPGGLRRQVIGFLPYWELTSPDLTLRYELLSTIAYFSVGSDTDGNLLKRNADGSLTTGWAGWTSSRMTSIIEAAHAAGTRVVLTVTMFAWSTTERNRQAALLGSESARANLARQLAAAVRDRGADGVNVDFEPIASGHAANFTAFVRSLRAELDAVAPGYEITVDTTGHVGNYELANLVAPGGADAIFLMGYDFRGSGAATAGAIAPIGGTLYDVSEAVQTFLRHIPASSLILGVPYYGRAWSTVSDAPNAKTQTGTRYGSSVTAEYQTAATLAEENGRRYDSVEQSAWTAYRKQNCSSTYGCVMTWRETYYDDPESLGAKYDMVNQLGLRGMGMWALGYDGTRPELWNALADKFLTPTVPTAEPALTLAASAGVITWGGAVVFSVHLGGMAPGQTIELQASPDEASWLAVTQLTTDAAGDATFSYTPPINRYYRAIWINPVGLTVPTDVKRVVVRNIALLRPTGNGAVKRVAPGTQVAFSTLVRPARVEYPIPMVRFVAYRLLGGRWTQVATQDVVPDAGGLAVHPFTFDAPGSWYVRSQAVPTPFNANSGWGPIERYDVR